MTITDTKKRTSETTKGTAPKHGSESDDTARSKPSASKAPKVIRRPAPQANPTAIPAKEAAPKPKGSSYEKRMRALAPVVRLRRKLEANAKRLSNVTADVERWSNAPTELRDAAMAIKTALASMLAAATGLPDNFMPERARKGRERALAIGTKVTIREKVAAKYEGILEPEERASLEVVSVTRSHVSVKEVSGARVVLPRNHVVKVAAT